MHGENPIDGPQPKTRFIPQIQSYLLLFVLFGYPLVSLLLTRFNAVEPEAIASKISQVYLPALAVQLFMLLVVLSVMGRSKEGFAGIGLAKNDITWSNILSGIIFFIGAWTLIIVIKGAIERSGYLPDKEFLYLLPVTIPERIVWFFLSLGAALSEEITFRGFAISRMKLLSGSFLVGATLSSAAFSAGHLYQGPAGVILTFLYGMLFSGLYVARRSVFPCIIAHFLQDVIILFIFKGPA
jgi:membrane protease YdiL (CAAX protease family)